MTLASPFALKSEGVSDLQSNASDHLRSPLGPGSGSKPRGLGIQYQGLDYFCRPTTIARALEKVYFANGVAPCSVPPSPSLPRLGTRSPEVGSTGLGSSQLSAAWIPIFEISRPSWFDDPSTTFATKTNTAEAGPKSHSSFPSATRSPLVGLFPNFNMYEETSRVVFFSDVVGPAHNVGNLGAGSQVLKDSQAGCSTALPSASPSGYSRLDYPLISSLSSLCESPSLTPSSSPSSEDKSSLDRNSETTSSLLSTDVESIGPSDRLLLTPRRCHQYTFPTVENLESSRTRSTAVEQQSLSIKEETDRASDVLDPLDSPLFNAHLGVGIEDLHRRAQHYRQRHPGQTIDRAWFSAFAGKLTREGKPMDEFRCYVFGCSQINQREDHILTHVSTHAGDRPFACRPQWVIHRPQFILVSADWTLLQLDNVPAPSRMQTARIEPT
ncbi:hypothetical protein EW146_g1168 [Bondarzewia mesenterica]|uniref:C2H2-type domain-containing protein n=1 Tax=Bondarzewia mesenterica TaxID=1095465 RepID=A0A4S4M4S7_9AGAM|nr:hypothetical protein EW146_g1168 [Bondarzewia mesenterica]